MAVHDSVAAPDAWAAAVLCHPHPQMGGNRFHPVVDALYRALPPAGVTALRFDFSSADPDVARGEVRAALEELDPSVPRYLVGYSFGADMVAGVVDPRVAGWVLVAPPLHDGSLGCGADPRPKLLLPPEHDQFSPPDRVRAATAAWPATELDPVPGADHFLAGRAAWVADRVVAWLTTHR